MRETEIRPDELMAGQGERFARDVRRLLARSGEFVEVPCPACAGTAATEAFRKYDLSYARCLACETVYVSPRPTPQVLADYYAASENYAYWNQFIFPASEAARREKIFRPRAERLAEICRRHGVGGGALLEVGAGFGTFCEEVRRLGLFERVLAVEPTRDLAETCRGRGLDVIERRIEEVDLPPESIDVVASFEAIEHLFSPADFVSACARTLRPGGLLVLTCPSIKGFDLSVLGPASDAVDVEHLNYFHPRSLSSLVESRGFETVEVETPGHLDAELVRKKVLSGAVSLKGQPFLEEVLLERWDELGAAFQEFLRANRLSSHLWLVARKKG